VLNIVVSKIFIFLKYKMSSREQLVRTVWTDSVRGLLLLFLAILANFLGVTMNCQLQKRMTESALFRNVAIFCLIYFTINFTSQTNLNPGWLFLGAIPIYILFILLTKQKLWFLLSELFLILIIFVMSQLRTFYENKETQGDDDVQRNKRMIDILNIIIYYVATPILVVVLLVGFVIYRNYQKGDRLETSSSDQKFDNIKFFFGTNKCAEKPPDTAATT